MLGGLWLERAGSDDALLFFHGNGEAAADRSAAARGFSAALDASVWLVDYRGYGRSDGSPSYSTMLTDAETVFAALADREKTRGRPFRRRYVLGRSIGSAPAIHLAWRFPDHVAALVVDSGFARVTDLVRQLRKLRGLPAEDPLVPAGFRDNVDKLRACAMPALFVHGANDTLIPSAAARENLAASAAPGSRLVEIPDAGHNDLLVRGWTRYREELQALASIFQP